MEVVQPNSHILLRVASGQTRLLKIEPNTTIGLGRFGSFPANALIGRPYYLTWDVLDAPEVGLKLVPVKDVIDEQINAPLPPPPAKNGEDASSSSAEEAAPSSGLALEDSAVGVEVTDSGGEDTTVAAAVEVPKDNREIRDDRTAQTLTAREIEELKKRGDTDGGRGIISRLLESHVHIDKKTSFSLAKYTLRKAQKYLKRITVLPVDVPAYTSHLLSEKEPMKIMEMRDEALGLMMSWADVKWGGRWLVVDETGGLVVAAVAERMGLLTEGKDNSNNNNNSNRQRRQSANAERKRKRDSDSGGPSKKREVEGDVEVEEPEQEPEQEQEQDLEDAEQDAVDEEGGVKLTNGAGAAATGSTEEGSSSKPVNDGKEGAHHQPHRRQRHTYEVPTSNTITLLHPLDQPNLSQLKPFSFDVSSPSAMGSHPLSRQLLPLTYLQLLSPEQDPFLNPPPETLTDEQMRAMKASKRNTHAKRVKRWEKQMKIIESTRKGQFDGVIVATGMELGGILNTVVPLVRGSGQIVIYSPNVEPLAEVADWCSTLRRSEFQRRRHVAEEQAAAAAAAAAGSTIDTTTATNGDAAATTIAPTAVGNFEFPPLKIHEPSDDFPVDPQLLLAPTVHTSRMRRFQALPGRTHPLMTSRGGSEGYVLHATRVLPVMHEAVRAMGTRIKPKKRPAAAAKAREEKEKEREEKENGENGDDAVAEEEEAEDEGGVADAEPMAIDETS